MENQGAVGRRFKAHVAIKVLDFKPFVPADKHTECACRERSTRKPKRITKGMTGTVVDICARNRTEEIEKGLEADVEEFPMHGLRALAIASEEVEADDHEAEGNGSGLIGILPIFDPSLSASRSRRSPVISSPLRTIPDVVSVWAAICIPPRSWRPVLPLEAAMPT